MADAADARAGIRTRPGRDPTSSTRVLARFEATWGEGRGPDRSMVQALEHAGNTRAHRRADGARPGCRRARRHRLGAPRFLGWSGGLHLHSHMNAVDPAARGRGIGVALKLRQRAVCLAHGVDEMRWTYDPLIRRNARLNLVRLGAEVVAFLPDFYGELGDAITGSRPQRPLRGAVAPRLAAHGASARPRPASRVALRGRPRRSSPTSRPCAPRTPRSPRRLRDASRTAFAVLARRHGAARRARLRPATTSSHATTPTGRPDERHDARDRRTATHRAHRAAPPRGAAGAAVRDLASAARRCARCSSCTSSPTRATAGASASPVATRSTRASTSTARHP